MEEFSHILLYINACFEITPSPPVRAPGVPLIPGRGYSANELYVALSAFRTTPKPVTCFPTSRFTAMVTGTCGSGFNRFPCPHTSDSHTAPPACSQYKLLMAGRKSFTTGPFTHCFLFLAFFCPLLFSISAQYAGYLPGEVCMGRQPGV
jgi:hypothetical protein